MKLLSDSMRMRALASAAVVIAAGCLLHFAWQWSGRSDWVAVVASTNESTWEHLKLAFWPALALAPVQRLIYGPLPGWLPATAIRCLLPSVRIVALFYGYTGLLGHHHLAADLAVFAVAIIAGEILGHVALTRTYAAAARLGSAGLLIVATLLFATLTRTPPNCFLFRRPDLPHSPG